jgi:hypothetical protein
MLSAMGKRFSFEYTKKQPIVEKYGRRKKLTPKMINLMYFFYRNSVMNVSKEVITGLIDEEKFETSNETSKQLMNNC